MRACCIVKLNNRSSFSGNNDNDKGKTNQTKKNKHYGCCRLTKTRTKRNKNHKLSRLISFLEMMRHSN